MYNKRSAKQPAGARGKEKSGRVTFADKKKSTGQMTFQTAKSWGHDRTLGGGEISWWKPCRYDAERGKLKGNEKGLGRFKKKNVRC